AALSVVAGPKLPPSLAGLPALGPYVALFAAGAIALWFNRGRAFIAALSMFCAYAGYRYAVDIGPFAAKVTYTALVVLVPANILASLMQAERGVFHHHNHRWPLVIVAELLLVLWVASAGVSSLSGEAWKRVFDHWLLNSPPTPLVGRLLFAAAFAAAMWRSHPKPPAVEPRALDIGLAGALVAFFVAAEWGTSPAMFATFMTAAGAVLFVAVLQETHRLAFADELTGLPGRRALNERLTALGPVCAVAMADVDHFKKFNDVHGHDIGDQVLKLVAARLAEVQGDGVAFRYGGEEFCVLFDGKSVAECLPHLEAIRASVEAYQMAVRSEARPRDPDTGSRLRGASVPTQMISVTISIGVAGRQELDLKPSAVVKAADQALYRAKEGGRNRVST
ncbi:MAG: GGDEF domain-containing protein, partial [Burkholderiaceae bacterium]